MTAAPIALFVYRRPDCARLALESLLRNESARNSEIFIFSDAAKTPDVEKDVAEVRQVVRATRGFRKITLSERTENAGLARSIIDGVTSLCESHGRVIVVEDDLVVAQDFLTFMNWGLDQYADESKVMQLAGHLFPANFQSSDDALFLPLPTSWGWATWQRAWQHFDPEAEGYEVLRSNAALRRRFDLENSYPYFRMLELQLSGGVDSWAIRWYLSVFLSEGLVLYPKENLVIHDGWGSSATHTKVKSQFGATAFGARQVRNRAPFPAVDDENVRKLIEYFRKATKPTKWKTTSRLRARAAKMYRALNARISGSR